MSQWPILIKDFNTWSLYTKCVLFTLKNRIIELHLENWFWEGLSVCLLEAGVPEVDTQLFPPTVVEVYTASNSRTRALNWQSARNIITTSNDNSSLTLIVYAGSPTVYTFWLVIFKSRLRFKIFSFTISSFSTPLASHNSAAFICLLKIYFLYILYSA
jgi:hypothetical protein